MNGPWNRGADNEALTLGLSPGLALTVEKWGYTLFLHLNGGREGEVFLGGIRQPLIDSAVLPSNARWHFRI